MNTFSSTLVRNETSKLLDELGVKRSTQSGTAREDGAWSTIEKSSTTDAVGAVGAAKRLHAKPINGCGVPEVCTCR